MLPLKLVRSMTHFPSHGPANTHHDDDDDDDDGSKTRTNRRRMRRARTPLLLFTPTREIIQDTYRLSSIARDIGMDLYPNSSLSHIIFSWPSPITITSSSSTSTISSSSSSCRPSFSSSTSSSTPLIPRYELPNGAVPLPFPSLTLASVSLLRYFVSISNGLFKLAFVDCDLRPDLDIDDRFSTWDCSSLSLVSRGTGFRVETMDGFSRVLAGNGWTMFQTRNKGLSGPGDSETQQHELQFHGSSSVFLFRKVDSNRVRGRQGNGEGSRIRELRLPPLDFKNVPLRILQYIILMTDDIFFLA